jgi:hypothetical protein
MKSINKEKKIIVIIFVVVVVAGNFLSSREPVSFSRRTLHME